MTTIISELAIPYNKSPLGKAGARMSYAPCNPALLATSVAK